LPESDEHGKHANKAIVDIFSGQVFNFIFAYMFIIFKEVDGGQSPSPTEINDAKTSEEKISELEEEMASYDGIRFFLNLFSLNIHFYIISDHFLVMTHIILMK